MNYQGILLRRTEAGRSYDEDGVEVKSGVLLAAKGFGPYAQGFPRPVTLRRNYVPALFDLCVDTIKAHVQLLDSIGSSLDKPRAIRCVQSIVRTREDLQYIHPLTWVEWIRDYSDELPNYFHTYASLALCDTNIRQLSRISSTHTFTLVINLSLSRSSINDQNIRDLAPLDNLCVLDTSCTYLTAAGVQALFETCGFSEQGELRGPWRLRVWNFRNCPEMNAAAVRWLERWPLLCAVDLRGTRIGRLTSRADWHPSTADETPLFSPNAFGHLKSLPTPIFPSSPFSFEVSSEHYLRPAKSHSSRHSSKDLYMIEKNGEETASFKGKTGRASDWLAKEDESRQDPRRRPARGYILYGDDGLSDDWWHTYDSERDFDDATDKSHTDECTCPECEGADPTKDLSTDDGSSLSSPERPHDVNNNSEGDAWTAFQESQRAAARVRSFYEHPPAQPPLQAQERQESVVAVSEYDYKQRQCMLCRSPPPYDTVLQLLADEKVRRASLDGRRQEHADNERGVARKRQRTVTETVSSLSTALQATTRPLSSLQPFNQRLAGSRFATRLPGRLTAATTPTSFSGIQYRCARPGMVGSSNPILQGRKTRSHLALFASRPQPP